jgi:hypothetical protein
LKLEKNFIYIHAKYGFSISNLKVFLMFSKITINYYK